MYNIYIYISYTYIYVNFICFYHVSGFILVDKKVKTKKL